MLALALFASFLLLFVLGTPVAVALGLAGTLAIYLADLNVLATPTSAYTGIAKYPLLAVPMFVLVGAIFDRSGVALRLVNFTQALIGRKAGSLAAVTVIVSMFLGGISGSGPANAAAVGGAMMGALSRAGYPRAFSASVIGAAAATDILIPPSIALIIYSVLVPQASVPALFAAGMIPGILAGVALLVPIYWMSKKHGFGLAEKDLPRPPLWASFKEAIWGLLAPVLILGGMRAGWFTPTEAAVMAVVYGLFVGFVIYRSLTLTDLYEMFVEAAEISGRHPDRRGARLDLRLGRRDARRLRPRRGGDRRDRRQRIRHPGASDRHADRHRHVPRRRLDLPHPAAAADADRQPFRLGPGVVRHRPDAQDRHRPVHAADGREPHGLLPHRRRAHGGDAALGVPAHRGDVRGAPPRDRDAAALALAAACARILR
jgi:hypothetical protein